MNQETQRRSHLTKEQRLPQSYKEVEKILNKVKKCEANVKTVLHNSKLRGAVLHKVSGLTFNVLKQRRLLDSIIEKIQILEKEPYLRKELAGILIHEMIFGNGLPGKSKPVETVLKYQFDIANAYNDLKSDDKLFSSLISIPKYVRINTLMITLPEVLEDLENLGVSQVFFDASISEKEFYELVKNLEKNTFLQDYHFKDLLIFHGEENLTTWSLYQRGHVFIQDKSSYIPAYALAPPPGATVIDACAAPGMKTLHLTALMENNGVVYAFERDQQRFEILNKMLKSGHANICQTFCGDFNLVDPRDEKYSSVEYILLDPSCSGSGMVNRMDCITDTKESKNDSRIQKLAGFQIILLKHALLFPSVKRVVYSTCSITETENEFVVHEVLNHFSHRFKLSPVLPEWSIRGSDDFEFGSHCLRASPDKCFTNGFFVAMFERLEDGRDQQHFQKKQHKREKKKHFHNEYELNNEKDTIYNDFESKNLTVEEERNNDVTFNDSLTTGVEVKKNHKKKHKNDKINGVSEKHTDIDIEKVVNDEQNNEKNIDNNKNQSVEEERNDDVSLNDTLTKAVEEMPAKKKHKKKHKNDKINGVSEKHTDIDIEKAVNDKQNNEKTIDNNLENKNQSVEEERNNDASLNDTLTKVVEKMPHKKKHKKKHKGDKINGISEKHTDIDIEKVVNDKQNSEKTIDSNFENKNQSLKEERNNDVSSNDTLIKAVEEMPHKKKHKKKHKGDKINDVYEKHTDTEKVANDEQNNDFTSTVKKTKSHKKHKHDKEYYKSNSESNNLFAIQDADTSTKLEPEKEKNHRNNACSNSLNDTESCNPEERTLTEMSPEIKISHKKRKHKRQYENEDSYNSLCKSQNSDTQVELSNIKDDILIETVQKVEKRKKRKRKHEIEEKNNSLCETQMQNSNIENDTSTETMQIEHFKQNRNKKKHKRKHEIEEYNKSVCEIKVENSDLENNNLTETVHTEDFSHKKKKKHKRKHDIEEYTSFSQSQEQNSNIGNNALSETVQTEDFSEKKKKKHKIEKYDSSFCVQNSNAENNTLTKTMEDIDTLHKKKKHKRKHQIEN